MRDQQHGEWERQYPIKQKEEHQVSRRQFGVFCGCSLAALGLGVPLRTTLRELPAATDPIRVAAADEIPRGGAKLFKYPSKHHPCILVRLRSGRHAAYSQSCTHLMCPVHFDAASQQLVCPCHQGYFDASDGSVLSGPPQRGLPQYRVEVIKKDVWVGPEIVSVPQATDKLV